MFWVHMQMFWLCICKCIGIHLNCFGFILNLCYILVGGVQKHSINLLHMLR